MIKKCFVEILYSLKRGSGMAWILLVLAAFCIGVGKVLISYFISMEKVEQNYEKTYTEQNIYDLWDNFVGEYENYDMPENYGKLMRWNEALHASAALTFVEMNRQAFVRIAEDEKRVYDGCYVGRNYFEEFPADVVEGRLFSGDDFVYEEGKCMPVLVGAAYQKEFVLGERFLADTAFLTTEVYVVGFLKEKTLLCGDGKLQWADDYIFFPMVDFPEQMDDGENDAWLVYMKNLGIVKTSMTKEETQDYLYRLCDSLGMPGVFYIPGAMNQRISQMAVSMKEIMRVSGRMLAILAVITVLAIVFYISRKMKRNWNYYSVLYLVGFTKCEVFAVMQGDLLILLLVANILGEMAFAVWRELNGSAAVGLWYNAAASVFFLFVPLFVSVYGFQKKDLCSRLMQEDSYL